MGGGQAKYQADHASDWRLHHQALAPPSRVLMIDISRQNSVCVSVPIDRCR